MPRASTYPRPATGGVLLIALCLMALLGPISASAAERVGQVLIASGDVTAQREGVSARDLSRKDPIYAQDTIETGADGRVQIQFSDGGMVDLQPDSRFRIAEYELEEDSGGSAIMELLRGALRTVTGSIGDHEDDEYRMDTPVATIGIRGTAYALHYCDAACANAGRQLGLYGRVDNGEITVGSGSDVITLGAGQFFFVPEDTAPHRIVAPPAGILDGNGDNGDGNDGAAPTPGDTPPPQDESAVGLTDDDKGPLAPGFEASETTDLLPGITGEVFFAGAFFSEDTSDSTFLLSPDDGYVRLQDNSADSPVVGSVFPALDVFASVDASDPALVEQDSTTIDSFDIHWGRWDGEVQVNGSGDPGGFIYAYTAPSNLTPTSVVDGKVDQLDYEIFDGPAAIASDGTLWTPTAWKLELDFQANESTLHDFDLASGGSTLNLVTTPTAPTGTITDSATVTVDSVSFNGGDWSGEIEGRFVGDDAQAIVIRYELDEVGDDDSIKGVLITEEGGT